MPPQRAVRTGRASSWGSNGDAAVPEERVAPDAAASRGGRALRGALGAIRGDPGGSRRREQ
eukprot:5233218-Alexandrium_andersonii.AAC.1